MVAAEQRDEEHDVVDHRHHDRPLRSGTPQPHTPPRQEVAVRFGLQIFQDATLARPNLWDNLLRMVLAAEDSGWSSLWMWDHVQLPPPYNPPGEAPMLECMVGLGGLAVATKRVLLGQLVLGVPYRNPALVAKMASTLDVMSHGRSVLGIGAGWAKEEYEAYGWGEWPETPARMRQLADAIRVILAMFGRGPATYEGRHYRVRGALNDPPPVQRPHPPVMIGGSGERTTLRSACTGPGPERPGGRLECRGRVMSATTALSPRG